jgi:hypothetical protein
MDWITEFIRMRCFWFCIGALLMTAVLAIPALAQRGYDGYEPRGRGDGYQSWQRGDAQEPRMKSHAQRHRRSGMVAQRLTEPSRQGPAPVGFWYRCDAPTGYYPYILTCQTPWRTVPTAPYR